VPLHAPGAQRIAAIRVLDFDDLGAEIGQLEREHVARDETGKVEHADAVEGTTDLGSERKHRLSRAERSATS
jgi:hypothetical protein